MWHVAMPRQRPYKKSAAASADNSARLMGTAKSERTISFLQPRQRHNKRGPSACRDHLVVFVHASIASETDQQLRSASASSSTSARRSSGSCKQRGQMTK